MNKIIRLLPLILMISTSSLMAQEINKPVEGRIVFEAKMANNIKTNYNKKQRLILNVSTFGSNLFIAPCTIYDLDIYGKPFKIDFPSTTNFTYLNLDIENIIKERSTDNVYLLERGDSIKLVVSDNDYEFYGIGADKLNCQREMYNLQFRNTEADNNLLSKKHYDTYFNTVKQKTDSIFKIQVEIVNKYALKLGIEMTEIMLANAYGYRYASILNQYIMDTRLGSPDMLTAFLKSDAYKNIDMSLSQKLNPRILIASSIYCNFLMEKIIVDNTLDRNSNVLRSNIEMPSVVFQAINRNYTGLIREKLLAMFFLKYKKNSESYQYLDEVLKTVENGEIKSILLNIQKTQTKGAVFFPFELDNVNGVSTRLSDLNGKVVVLDFWYTGCENCIILHEGMKPVIESFKNNSKVQFVSISIDKDKSSWLKSVASGKYTDPDGLNLYTNGLGSKHPLIETYYIRGYPAIFVLKNGKIISASPPRPVASLTKASNEAKVAFISLIEEALNDNFFLP